MAILGCRQCNIDLTVQCPRCGESVLEGGEDRVEELLSRLRVQDAEELARLVEAGRRASAFGGDLFELLDFEIDAYGRVLDVRFRGRG